ncbi:translation initiation factor eIF 4e-like domain-containing protein [Rhodofomes roseus]|uniref:Translation initiation factor eIF 4e-like domain-containing protein n=1 Tax=Rhodofomes roseus TaxID=34475 RepID=A0ABQ8K9E8_9APHY|nr:translation initiation factor eIF 4e-like domain-containing protein [Rhodofomes roseus]KAH9834002.1 translation initiation factor eIF 4e-like domain-containing protein [Rhodofomes roseus]
MSSDDNIPSEYPYAWSSSSQLSPEEFLTKYKPSMIQDDGTKPWLWIRKSTTDPEDTDMVAAVEEATEILEDVTTRVEEIKNDDSIPVRANKKKGTKSKKEVRETVQSEATEKLKDISIRHGFVSGKWLIFAPTDKVDLVWSTIANSLISGPLASTSAHCAKVATCPKHEVPNYSHVLCLYVPNVYDKEDVTEIMKILLRKHGMNLMGVKSNLYTAIGLDSKHPSGIPSTVWKNSALMPETDIKKLKEEYFAELAAAKNNDTEKTAARKAAAGTVAKSKPKLKRKAENDDPFASEDDEPKDTKSEAKSKSQAGGASTSQKTAKAAPKTKKSSAKDEFGSDDEVAEDSDAEARKAEVAAKKATSRRKGAKRPKEDDDNDNETEDIEERPRQKVRR